MKKFVYMALFALSVCACGGGDGESGGNGGGNNGNGNEQVFTGAASNVTATTATISGNFTSAFNASNIRLGVLFSTEKSTVDNMQGTLGLATTFSGSTYSVELSNLLSNTIYYYRAYMQSGGKTYYGSVNSFTTQNNKYEYNGHEAIDLGLPSGTKWATTNLEADSPEDNGGYFAWGEKFSKFYFTKQNYEYQNWNLGMNISGTMYDPAIRKWSEPWCMPTKEDMEELVQYCTFKWTTSNGVNGALMTGPNGNSIFFPAAGVCVYANYNSIGEAGQYWSSNINGTPGSSNIYALRFSSTEIEVSSQAIRYQGRPIRPVCK